MEKFPLGIPLHVAAFLFLFPRGDQGSHATAFAAQRAAGNPFLQAPV